MIQINSPAKSGKEEGGGGEERPVAFLLGAGLRRSSQEGWLVLWLVVDLNAGCFGISVVLVGVFHCLWLHYN